MADKKQEIYLWAIFGLAILAYLISLNFPFLLDDVPFLVENSTIRHLIPDWRDYLHGGPTRLDIRPVADLTFRINYQTSQLNVWSYHLFNILIHAANGCLLFLVLQKLFSLRRPEARFGEGAETVLSAIIAAIWVVHPLQVNAVTYIIQRWESLAALFYLASLYGFLRWRVAGEQNWKWICLACAYAAVGSKESAVSLPLAILLLDRYFVSANWKETLSQKTFYAILAGAWVFLAALVIISFRLAWTQSEGAPYILSLEYFKIQTAVIWHYLQLLVFPHPLVFDYGYWPAVRWYFWIPSAAILAAVLGAALYFTMRRSLAGYAGFLFFILLAASSSFLPIPTVPAAEYRMYLPSACIIGLLVCAIYSRFLAGKVIGRGVSNGLLAGAGLIILALLVVTISRNYCYRSPVTLWADNLEKRPLSLNSYVGLADGLMNAGSLNEADTVASKAREKFQENAKVLNLAGMIKFRQKQPGEAEKLWLRAVELRPDAYDIHNNLGILYAQEEKWEPARKHFERLVELRPYDVIALGNLAQLCLLTKDYRSSAEYARKGLELAPNDEVLRKTSAMLEAQQWK